MSTPPKNIRSLSSLQLLCIESITMWWSCFILFLVATATGKWLTVADLRFRDTQVTMTPTLSLYSCPLTGLAAVDRD